jgi:hypothetical protein
VTPRPIRRIARAALTGLAVLLVLPYAWGPIYRFPEPGRFSGGDWWNPYEKLGGTWQRANLHAHGRAWVGLTNGRQDSEAVVRRYTDLGYSVAGVSNYQQIATPRGAGALPLYEHGYNLAKSHQVVIGARAVEWFDFPLWQSASHQQYVIDRVKRKADLVALAHPGSRDAYSVDRLQQLTGYDLIEVVNGPFAVEDSWDSALSSGRPVWVLANDDNHDLADPRRTATGWNMVDSPTADARAIVDALRRGRSYAALRTGAIDAAAMTMVEGVHVADATLRVRVSGAAATFTFIGQGGVIRKTVKDATEAVYDLSDGDTYVRTVIQSPQTVLYLNPVVRYDGSDLPKPAATVDVASTWLLRGSSALGAGLALVVYSRRRRLTMAPVAPGDAMAGIRRHIA